MSQIATGVFRQVRVARQAALGTIAPTNSVVANLMRRTKCTLDLAKANYKSTEILLSQQRRDMRHGVKSVAGVLTQELSAGCAQPFMESICRQVVQASINTGAIIIITAAVTTAPAGTFTRSAGSFLTDGFKLGDVVRWTGWTTTGVNNNSNNFMIIALTATIMTCYPLGTAAAVAAKAAGDSVTCTVIGKKTWIPQSGQVRHYYTAEHWFSDIAQDEVFTDCVVSKMLVKMPSSGMATVDFDLMGLNLQTTTAQYFTAANALPTGGIEASANGLLVLNGVVLGLVTSCNFDTTGNFKAIGGVVGTNVDPDILPGSIDVTGTLTILFVDNIARDLFINETEFNLIIALVSSTAIAADFTCFNFPRVKFSSATKDDAETQLTLTENFTALENLTGGITGFANLNTTLSIQDSLFV